MNYPAHWNFLDHTTPEQDLQELVRLTQLSPCIGDNRKMVIEVGSWVGGTAYAILQALCPVDMLYCVDDWNGSDRLLEIVGRVGRRKVFETFCSNLREYLMSQVVPLAVSSDVMAPRWPANFPVSMIFIDADHDNLAQDVELWLPHLVPGGIMCGHDYGVFPLVTRDVEAMRDRFQINVTGSVWSFRKPV
jgi:predicted O-methyltransferase YrrM